MAESEFFRRNSLCTFRANMWQNWLLFHIKQIHEHMWPVNIHALLKTDKSIFTFVKQISSNICIFKVSFLKRKGTVLIFGKMILFRIPVRKDGKEFCMNSSSFRISFLAKNENSKSNWFCWECPFRKDNFYPSDQMDFVKKLLAEKGKFCICLKLLVQTKRFWIESALFRIPFPRSMPDNLISFQEFGSKPLLSPILDLTSKNKKCQIT